ncbi:MAG: 30S ribosomal protein S9 [Planctomycetia bacterium]|nr:30S ribosomal protein S9 [Planctomycetia bacterium]
MADPKNKKVFHLGTGRRKTSVARVRLSEGTGKIAINGRELNDYFTEERDRYLVVAPLQLTEMRDRLDLKVLVQGGGYTGQAGAICQGLARALLEMFEPKGSTPAAPPAEGTDNQQAAAAPTGPGGMAKKLRDSGFLTRDSRMKERKKYGLKGARKAFQFSKR